MLSIITNTGAIDLHVGSHVILDQFNRNYFSGVDFSQWVIQADGHELSAIIDQFPGLIIPQKARSIRWYGETARFIVGNLRLE